MESERTKVVNRTDLVLYDIMNRLWYENRLSSHLLYLQQDKSIYFSYHSHYYLLEY